MEGSSEKPAQRQVNIRLSEETYERIRTWGFLEDEPRPGKFLAGLIDHIAESVAATDPDIDDLIRIGAEYRANKAASQIGPSTPEI
jgi:hypothetical protein